MILLIPKQDLIDDIKNINDELDRWNRNPWLPTKYIKTLVESHLSLYEKYEALQNESTTPDTPHQPYS